MREVKIGHKGGKQHRGFCFVDYVSKTDAGRAMGALVHSTHLYGRRLVLEWDKQESTVAEMIGRTAVKITYALTQLTGAKHGNKCHFQGQ